MAVLGLCCCVCFFLVAGSRCYFSGGGAWLSHCCGFSCSRVWTQNYKISPPIGQNGHHQKVYK